MWNFHKFISRPARYNGDNRAAQKEAAAVSLEKIMRKMFKWSEISTFWKWMGGGTIITGTLATLLAWAITEGKLALLKDYWSAVREWVTELFLWLGADVPVVRWRYYALVGVLGAVVLSIVWYLLASLARAAGPSWRSYTKDAFFDIVWRWSYDKTGSIDRISCFCQKCDRQIIAQEVSSFPTVTAFICQHCGEQGKFQGSYSTLVDAAHREIDVKLRSGSWIAVSKEPQGS